MAKLDDNRDENQLFDHESMRAMRTFFVLICWLLASITASAQTTTLTLYLGNSEKNPGSEDCTKVYKITRTVPKTSAVATAALNALFAGVTDDEKSKKFESLFSKESADILKSVNIHDGAAYVNFHASVKQNVSSASSSCGRDMFFAQVDSTLKQFRNVKRVFYAIEGKPADFYAWMEMARCPKALVACSAMHFK
jgi:spore germination protein GerM